MSIISDQKVCPISFNVYQRLKLKLWKKSFKSIFEDDQKETIEKDLKPQGHPDRS